MGKTSLILALIGLGLAAIGIPVTLDQLGVMDLGGEKSDISLNLVHADGESAKFTLSNSKGGISFVDKIELITDNFASSPECFDDIGFPGRLPTTRFDTTLIKNVPATYLLENFTDESNNERAKISSGLNYPKDDADSFVVPYFLVDSNDNPVSESVTFDVKIIISWCDLNDCNKKPKESETQNVTYLIPC